MTHEKLYEKNFNYNKKSEGKVCELKRILEHEIEMVSKGLKKNLMFVYDLSTGDEEWSSLYELRKNELIAYPGRSYYSDVSELDDNMTWICVVKDIESIRISDNKLIIKGKHNYKVKRKYNMNYAYSYVSVQHDEKEPMRVFHLADIYCVYRVKENVEDER